jgi:hypothetical protein
VDEKLFSTINKCLEHQDLNDTARIQICRALGNLCYYNDKARLAYLNSCDLNNLFGLLKYCTDSNYSNCSEEEICNINILLAVTIGFLHNLTNENSNVIFYLKIKKYYYILKSIIDKIVITYFYLNRYIAQSRI